MDIATLLGIIIGFAMVIFGILTSGGVDALGSYVDIPSIIITLGGTLTSVLTSCTISEYITGFKSIAIVFKIQKIDENATIKSIIDLSNVARKEGLLALEEIASTMEDEFLRKGILLIVDGTEPDLVRDILETELVSVDARHKKLIKFWENLAAMGPAWGMIGTLVGLVNMLNNMSDPNSIGPSMATALLTTLYGSLIANWISTPIATKLSINNDNEFKLRQVMIEGLLSIQAGENPRVIEEKLKSFISPAQRKTSENADGAAGGEA